MSGLALGCIADDYTGASDLANALSRAGLATIQTIGVPVGLALPPVDALVVSLKSRSVPAADAVAMAGPARAWLRGQGARHILFKICSTFDSTDAGNIGPVMDALRTAEGGAIVPVTPAFPETGRTIYMGRLFVGTQPLDESPLRDHPLNPMRDADLVRVLGRQSEVRVGLVDLRIVADGADAIEARLGALAQAGYGAAIIDGIVDSDLEAAGAAALRFPLSVGASGLGLGLARALQAEGVKGGTDSGKLPPLPDRGFAAVLSGSCSQATLTQIAAAEPHMPVLRIDPARLIAGGDPIDEALACARARIGQGPVLIASSAPPDEVAALQARLGREAAGRLIEQAMARIAEGLVVSGVRRLVVAGGETAGAVVDRLGLRAFAVGPEIAAGVPLLRTIGAPDMLLALKSGNFGGPDFFAAALGMMEEKA